MNQKFVVSELERLGPWGHAYEILPGVWTNSEAHLNWRVGAFREQMEQRGLHVSELKILDLACLDGLFAIEYAKEGAQTVGVDIRPDNIARSNFAKETLGLGNANFKVSNVIDLIPSELGQFDVTLCCGLFYHLTANDCVRLLKIMRELTSGIVFLDTHISFQTHVIEGGYPLSSLVTTEADGEEYEGRIYDEFPENLPMEDRMKLPSSSVHNDKSFWFTLKSLTKALVYAGFGIDGIILPDRNKTLEQQGRPVLILR